MAGDPIVTALDAWSDAIERPVQTLATSSAIKITTVNPTAAPTVRVSARSDGSAESSCDRLRVPRNNATSKPPSTTMNTAVQTHSMRTTTHELMRPDFPLARGRTG